MRAIRVQSQVEKDRTLHIHLPADVEEGPVEVIVLVPEPAPPKHHSLEDFLASLEQSPRMGRSKEEIDKYLAEERESWDR